MGIELRDADWYILVKTRGGVGQHFILIRSQKVIELYRWRYAMDDNFVGQRLRWCCMVYHHRGCIKSFDDVEVVCFDMLARGESIALCPVASKLFANLRHH